MRLMLLKSFNHATYTQNGDLSQLFILQVDASNDELGAVLLQEEGSKKTHVAYASRKLKTRESMCGHRERMSHFDLRNSEISQVHLW